MSDAIELVGTDKPYKAAAGVNPPMQLNTPQAQKQQAVNSQAMQQSIGQAGQRMAQPLAKASETVQLKTQQELAAIQAQQQSDLRANMAQAQKAAAAGDTLSTLAQTAAQYLLQRKQMDESKKLEAQRLAQEQAEQLQKQRNEQAKQDALLILQEAEKEGYAKDPAGTTAYKSRVQALLEKSGADEETQTAILKQYVDSATAYDRQVNDRLYAEGKQAKDKVTEAAKAQLKFEMTAAMTELRENKFVNPDRVNALFNERIQAIEARTDLDRAQKDELRASAYTMFAQSLEGNVTGRAKLDELQTNYTTYREQEYLIQQQVAAGTLDQSKANAKLADLQAYYGVSASAAYDPYAGIKQQREIERLTTMPDNQMERITDSINQAVDTKFRMSETDLGAAAYGLLKMNGGAGLADLRSKPESERTPLEQRLVNRAEAIEKLLTKQQTLVRKEQEYRQSIAKFQQSSIKDLLRQAKGSELDSFTQGRIAAETDPAKRDAMLKAVGGKELSPEDEAALESSRKEILDAMTKEAQLNQEELADIRDSLTDFGITGNPEKDGERLRKGMESFNKTLELQTKERARMTTKAVESYLNPNSESGEGQNRFPDIAARSDLKTDSLPKGAVPLANGGFILNGQVFNRNAPTQATFNGAKRMNNAYVSELKRGEKYTNDLNANHGYKQLARNPEFTRALNETANATGIPAYWLADIMAVEQSQIMLGNGSIDRGTTNKSSGAVGLIQFIPSTARLMGTTPEAIRNMSSTQQMRTVVKQYIEIGQKETGGLRSGAELAAFVFGGGNLVRTLRRDPQRALRIGDGHVTFETYLKRMGAAAGRQMYIPGQSRANRIASATHTSHKDGCAICENFKKSGSPLIPHEPQMLSNHVTKNDAIVNTASSLKNFDTANAIGSPGGNVACVFALNKVLKASGIRVPWGESLMVVDARNALRKPDVATRITESAAKPGDIALWVGGGTRQHIGIVTGNGGSAILSNSSSRGRFSWLAKASEYRKYYDNVETEYYRLK